MAYTQTDLEKLQASIAKGAKRVKLGQEEVEFRDLAEMERLEARMKRELGEKPKSRLSYPQTSTGWR